MRAEMTRKRAGDEFCGSSTPGAMFPHIIHLAVIPFRPATASNLIRIGTCRRQRSAMRIS